MAWQRWSFTWHVAVPSLVISACGAGSTDGSSLPEPASMGGSNVVGGSASGAGTVTGSGANGPNGGAGGSPGEGDAGTSHGGTSAPTAGSGVGGGTSGGNGGGAGSSGSGSGAVGSGSGGGAGSSGSGGATEVSVPAGYQLVWHDEFDRDGAPDPANWKFEKGFARNEEAQWYQADNATVKDGLLVIEARKERVQNPNYTGSGDWKTTRQYAEYTSSSLLTSGLHSFQYGRFEMRGRIPTAAGMWPAWWTLGVNGEWPSNGEIDIMEFYQGKVLANVACGTSTRWQAKWASTTKPLSSLGADWSSKFHVWRMDWDDQKIVIYLDDQQLSSTALSSMLNPDGQSPFKQKAYMLVNLALGGVNGGDPSKTPFPQRYEVDYVRVFQKN